jgi:Flp pilus assembly pilin Flp
MTHFLQRAFAALASRMPDAGDERGQTFVEYALVLVLVAVAVSVLAAWTNLDKAIGDALQSVADAM